MTKLNIF